MSYLNYLHAGSLVILHSKRAVTVVPIACVGCPASRIARQEGSMTISSSSCNSTTANNKLSRKRQRPPNRSCSSNSQFLPGHVCKGGLSVLLIALLRCPGSAASQAGGGSPGGSFGNPGPPQRRGLHGGKLVGAPSCFDDTCLFRVNYSAGGVSCDGCVVVCVCRRLPRMI